MKSTTPTAVRLPQMRLDFTPQDIPEHILKMMAMASLDLTEKILREPGGRQRIDAETKKRKERKLP